MATPRGKMMSRTVKVLCIALAFYLGFQVKKISFISDGYSDLILYVSNTGLLNESFFGYTDKQSQ